MLTKGLLIVYTGAGKGKSTAAFGLATRALGHGMRIGIVQFVKSRADTGEAMFFSRFPGQVDLRTLGAGFVRGDPGLHEEAARSAWATGRDMMTAGFDMVILDEIGNVLAKNLLPVAEVVGVLKARPPALHVVATGRGAPPELIEAADLVTEMVEVKHPYRAGFAAQKGIEF